MSPLTSFTALPLLLAVVAALPAQPTVKSPSTATPPATTAPPTPEAVNGAIITPQITYGSTVVNGQTYPVVGGNANGGYRFSGTNYYVTGYVGGYLYNCYNNIQGTVQPALCFGNDEHDTEYIVNNGVTYYDGGAYALSGKLPGPLSGSAGGTVGIPNTAAADGVVTGVYTPALAPGDQANGGGGAQGTVTLGPISFGGQGGGSFVTKPGYTSYGAGAVGSLYVGPFGGAGTIGGDVVGTTKVGCAGLNVEGVGYTACVTAPS